MENIEDIIERYGDTITRICIMNLRNSDDAKDCFQEVFIKLYQYNKPFKDDEHLKAWLIRDCINTCRDYQRKFYKPFINIDDVILADKEEQFQLLPILFTLSPKYKNILYLYYYEGYKINEISSLLHINQNTIKSRLKRGRKLLKDKLGGEDFE